MEPEKNADMPHMELSSLNVPGGPPDGEVKPQSQAVPNTGNAKSGSSSSSGGDGSRKYASANDEASGPGEDVNSDFMNAGIHDQTESYQKRNVSALRHSSIEDKYGQLSRESKSAKATSSMSDANKEDDDGDIQIQATVQAISTRGSPVSSSIFCLVRDEEDKAVPSSMICLVHDDEDKAKSFLKSLARLSEQSSLSSFSSDEPLAQVSIAIFLISILFVVVACSMIIYWCGMGYCIDPRGADNGSTGLLTTTTQRKANF
ncbi:uncharacterized protein LOC144178496 [Haemaphysalis longicornis]